MRASIVVALTAATTFAAAAAGERGAETERDRLGQENRRLRAALAERDRQIEALRGELARLAAAVRQLHGRVAQLQAMVGGSAPAARAASTQPSRTLDIRVAKDDWGDSGVIDIEKVLRSAAGELWTYFPNRKLKPILVRRSKSGPIVLFQRGPNGEYIAKLDSQDRLWSQMAYQFAHEFCHILANYSPKTPRSNKWFEESLCEMASMFALRRMAQTWQTNPPWPNWKSYAPALGKYADNLLPKKDRGLPENTTLGQWYRANAEALRANPSDRQRNKLVAAALLPLFEKSPQSWEAISYLNLGRPEAAKSFEAYLANWLRHTPERHKPFVQRIIALFEIRLAAAPTTHNDKTAAGKTERPVPKHATVRWVKGHAQRGTTDHDKPRWERLQAGDRLGPASVVRTGLDAVVELDFGAAGRATLKMGSKLIIAEIGQPGEKGGAGVVRLVLKYGSLQASASEPGSIRVETPAPTLRVYPPGPRRLWKWANGDSH